MRKQHIHLNSATLNGLTHMAASARGCRRGRMNSVTPLAEPVCRLNNTRHATAKLRLRPATNMSPKFTLVNHY